MVSSHSGLSKKRTRTLNGTQHASCLVDGCTSDLSICREYHRSHGVYERHSMTPVVMVGGREQRFCQQCGARLLQFSDPLEYDTTTGGGSLTSPCNDKHQQQFHVIFQQSTSSNSFACTYGGRNEHFPFLPANHPGNGNQVAPEVWTTRRLLKTNGSPENSSHLKTLSEKIDTLG